MPIPCRVSRSDGRSGENRKVAGEGKSGLRGQTVPDNIRRMRIQGQCHREQTAAARCVLAAVRVKRCGKSAPRQRQRRRHGKPHREQDRIGTARGDRASASFGILSGSGRPGRLLEALGNRRPRGMAVTRVNTFLRAVQNPAYRLADVKLGAPGGSPSGARQISSAKRSNLACLLNGFHGQKNQPGVWKAFSAVRRSEIFSAFV
jgi:hypothetical protein